VKIIDTNVDLSRWPFRRVPYDETPQLVAKLRREGVVQAWAGSFDGLLHKDIAGVNSRLAAECKESRSLLVPFGSINPTLPDWQEDLRRCADEFKMPGIRLHPNYHGYKLDDPLFSTVLKSATDRGLIVQLAVLMEDRRMQHKLLPISPVELAPLPDVIKQIPGLRLQLLNAMQMLKGPLLLSIIGAGQVYTEIATVEGIGGVENLLREIPDDRLLFGSHSPLLIFESARLKLKESDLKSDQLDGILEGNAKRLLGKTAK
jgi:predicted TIM-barrel fold metal-dependent hydrolase